jgi:hypothetical protein
MKNHPEEILRFASGFLGRGPHRNGKHVRVLWLAVAFVLLAVWMTPAAAPGAAPEPPSRLLVTAREYSLGLSRPKVDAGAAIVELYDYGEDPHNLQLQRVGGLRVFSLGEVGPGETGRLEMRLRRRSTYRLWCSLDGHEARGMSATLRTSRH